MAQSMNWPVRLLVMLQLLLCTSIAASPLIVALALKPDLPATSIVDVLAERVFTGLVASIGMIGLGLLGWARFGATTFICVMLFFCPTFAALYFAVLGFR